MQANTVIRKTHILQLSWVGLTLAGTYLLTSPWFKLIYSVIFLVLWVDLLRYVLRNLRKPFVYREIKGDPNYIRLVPALLWTHFFFILIFAVFKFQILPGILLGVTSMGLWLILTNQLPLLHRNSRNPLGVIIPGIVLLGIGFISFFIALFTHSMQADATGSWIAASTLMGLGVAPFCALILNFKLSKGKPQLPGNIPYMDPDLSASQLITELNWEKPESGIAAARALSRPGDYALLTPLNIVLNKIPVISYRFERNQAELVRQLREELAKTMEEIVAPNLPFHAAPDAAWCRRCNERAAFSKIENFRIVLCRQCRQDDELIPGVQTAVGVLSGGTTQPDEDGKLLVPVWDRTENRVIPANIDQIVISEGLSVNYDWCVNACCEWILADNRFSEKRPRISLEGTPPLSDNSSRLIAEINEE